MIVYRISRSRSESQGLDLISGGTLKNNLTLKVVKISVYFKKKLHPIDLCNVNFINVFSDNRQWILWVFFSKCQYFLSLKSWKIIYNTRINQ